MESAETHTNTMRASRKGVQRGQRFASCGSLASVTAVSYTHLDVYKRQVCIHASVCARARRGEEKERGKVDGSVGRVE